MKKTVLMALLVFGLIVISAIGASAYHMTNYGSSYGYGYNNYYSSGYNSYFYPYSYYPYPYYNYYYAPHNNQVWIWNWN